MRLREVCSVVAYFILTATAVTAVAMAGVQFPQTCANGKPQFPDMDPANVHPATKSLPIDACGVTGADETGTPEPTASAEGKQNGRKNNFCATGTPAPITVASYAALQGPAAAAVAKQEAAAPKKPAATGNATKNPGHHPSESKGPPTDRSVLEGFGEGKVVVFEGYVFEGRQESKETVNCEDKGVPAADGSHDIHISLLAQQPTTNPDATDAAGKLAAEKEECTGIVAEMIPHHRPGEWTSCNVNDAAQKKLRVRVTGQQFYDGSHEPCKNGMPVGKNPKRVALWEIHPIYKFEVCPSGNCTSSGWQPLVQYDQGKTECVTKKEPSTKVPAK